MSRKAIIAIVIIVIVIIIGVVGFLIYKKNKDNKAAEAAKAAAILQAQLNANPNMGSNQRQDIMSRIADLIQQAQGGGIGTPPYVPQGGYQGPYALPLPPTGYVGPAPSGPGTPVAPYGFPLRSGSNTSTSQPNYVAMLQSAINAKCGKNLVPDGKFGPLTASAAQSCVGTPTVAWEQYRGLVG